MKKTTLVYLLVISLVLVSSIAIFAQSAAAQSTIERILQRNKLIIGTAPGYLPFEMLDKQGNFLGYDIDLGRAIGRALNVEVEFRQFPFASIIPALQTGEIDMVIAGMTIRGDRALAVSFSNPYYATGQVLMVPGNDTTTTNWQELDQRGKQIAVSQGTTGALLAKQIFRHATILDFEDFPTSTMALRLGQADGIVYDEPAVRIEQLKGGVRGIYELISAENLGIAVAHKDWETVHWLNSFLYSYMNSPAELESRYKWFSTSDWLEDLQ